MDRVLTFLPGETEKEISFMVVDDRIALEPTETLMWNLTMISPVEQGGVIAPYGDALIQIIDDDGTYVQNDYGKNIVSYNHKI